MATSDQCALGPDGKLLDASEIAWVHDPDDPTPIAPSQQSIAIPVLAPKVPSVHPFFHGGPAPAIMVAGSRRSGRVSQPSKRVLDPNNAERSDVSKRPRLVSHRNNIVESESDSHDEGCVEGSEAIVANGDGDRETTDTEGAGLDTDIESGMVDVEAAEESYAVTKAMGDADREFCSFLVKLMRVFQLAVVSSWVVGLLSVITLLDSFNIHLSNLGHVKIYTERCAKLGIATNNRVYAKSESLESIGQKQTTLDGVVTRQPRPPAFTTDGLLDYIIELVVSEDEAFQLTDKKPFCQLLTYLRPT
ncbi:hypothetical protein JOM56_014989, partial [Amanita muscaria]